MTIPRLMAHISGYLYGMAIILIAIKFGYSTNSALLSFTLLYPVVVAGVEFIRGK